jgi:hypothetical protein
MVGAAGAKQGEATGAVNISDPGPPLLLSREEKAIIALALVAAVIGLLALGVTVTMVYRALPRAGEAVDSGRLLIAIASFSAVFFGIVYVIFGRWPGRVSSQASMATAASPYTVWDAVALRDDYPGWKKIYNGIERLDEAGEVYRIDHAEDSECLRCLLPRDPDRSRWTSRVEIRDSRRPSLYRQAVFPKALTGAGDAEQPLAAEDFTILLEPLAGGGTHVTVRSVVAGAKVWFAFLCFLGWPMKEELRSLKAHLDRTPDETLFGIAAQRMAIAREAPRHCQCPEP